MLTNFFILSNLLKTNDIFEGTSNKFSVSFFHRTFNFFCSLPAIRHRQAKILSCAVNALVEATPISGPASMVIKKSDSLAILLSELLTILKILLPFFLANLKFC